MHRVRKGLSLLLSLAMVFSLSAPAFAAGEDTGADIMSFSYVPGDRVQFPETWKSGRNSVYVLDGDVTVIAVRHADGTVTECQCTDEDGYYDFTVNASHGEEVVAVLSGDITLNGETNSEDLALLASYMFHEYNFVDDMAVQYVAGDVTHNGETNSEDLALLAAYMFHEYQLQWNLGEKPEGPDPVETEKPVNTAPEVELEVFVTDDSQAGGYLENIQHQLMATVSGTDAEDETVRLYLKLDDGAWFFAEAGQNTLGYVQAGEHTVYAYAQDSEGLRSDVVEKVITVAQVSTLPSLVSEKVETATGRGFHASVMVNDQAADASVFEVWRTTWTLTDMSTGEAILEGFDEATELQVGEGSILVGNVSKYGLDLTLCGVEGEYKLTACSVDQYGNIIWMGDTTLEVKNEAPDANEALAGLSYTVDRMDVSDPYTVDAKAKVSFAFDGTDADGDVVTIYDTSTGRPLEDDYYKVGTTVLTLYPVDEWGLAGEMFEYSIVIANQTPQTPVITVDKKTADTKPVDGKLAMKVNTGVTSSDPDGDAFQLVYESEVPSGYYSTGNYLIKVKAVDILGGESEWAEKAWSLDDTPIEQPDEGGSFDVDTSFALTANGSKEITVHIGTPVTLGIKMGNFEAHELTYRQFLNGNFSVAQDTTKFGETELAAGQGMELSWTPVTTGDYTYEASAMANDKSGVTSGLTRLTDKAVIHVVNDAPEIPVVSAEIEYDDVTLAMDGTLKYLVKLTAESSDPDGDDITIMWDKASQVTGYFAPGTYAVTGVYAVDQWGQRSEENVIYRFTVASDGSPTVGTGRIIVHQGDEFTVTVHGGRFPIQELVFDCASEQDVATGDPVLQPEGMFTQKFVITADPGEYSLRVTARVSTGAGLSDMVVGSVPVTVYNTAPVLNIETVKLGSITGDTMAATFDFVASDSDDDTFVSYYSIDDGEAVAIGSEAFGAVSLDMPLGTHTLTGWSVDQWGKESVRVNKVIHASSYFLDNECVPTVTYEVTKTFENAYTADAKVLVNVDVVWMPELDMTSVDHVVSKVDGEEVESLTGYYGLGSHVVEVYCVDNLGVESQHGTAVIELKNTAPNVEYVETTSDRTDYVNGYTPSAAYRFDFNVLTSDEETPDALKVFTVSDADGSFVKSDGEVVSAAGDRDVAESVYYTIGRHAVQVYAVDVWGAKSVISTQYVTALNTAPEVDAAEMSKATEAEIVNPYTTEAAVKLYGDVSGSDADKDEYIVEYSINGMSVDHWTGMYQAGTYQMQVSIRDVFNGVGETSFEMTVGDSGVLVPEVSYELQGTWENAYTVLSKEKAVVRVDVSGDVKNRNYKVFARVDDAEFEELGDTQVSFLDTALALGEHELQAYAIDVWGHQSEIGSVTALLESEMPDATVIVTEQDVYENAFTTHCAKGAFVSVRSLNDFGEKFQTVIRWNEFLSESTTDDYIESQQWLTLGDNNITVAVTDIWGQTREVVNTTTLTNAAPTMTTPSAVPDLAVMRDGFTATAAMKTNVTEGTPGDEIMTGEYAVQTHYLMDGASVTDLSDIYLARGDHKLEAYAVDVWGEQSATIAVPFAVTNQAPTLSAISATVDLKNVRNGFTTNAAAKTTVTQGTTSDEQNEWYPAKTYYELDGVAITSFDDLFLKEGRHTLTAYAQDVWCENSAKQTYTFNVTGKQPTLTLTSTSGLTTSNPVTSSSTANFAAGVSGSDLYQVKYLDYYVNGKPVTTVSNGGNTTLTGASQAINRTWPNGRHLLIAQVKDIMGKAAYGSFYFMTGMSSGSGGSVGIDGTTASTTTEGITMDGKPLAYISSFTVSVPEISGHGSGDGDYLCVTGIDANGAMTQLVKFSINDACCSVTANNGSGSWTAHTSSAPSSGTFTYDPMKYVQLKLEFYSPHADCMAGGGASMVYSMSYGFVTSSDAIEGLDELFK